MPEIEEVRFENIGEEVVAKIAGASMWFVYNVSINGVNGNGKDLEVNVKKSSESEVQARMREASIVHEEEVSVRVKTHFQNSKYLPAKKIPAKTTVRVCFFCIISKFSFSTWCKLNDILQVENSSPVKPSASKSSSESKSKRETAHDANKHRQF